MSKNPTRNYAIEYVGRGDKTDVAAVVSAAIVAAADPTGDPIGDVVDGDTALASLVVMTPAQLTANQNDWNPVDATDASIDLATADVIRASTDASRNLTGIVASADVRLLVLENIGAFDLVLKHDVTSTAANRFYCPNDTDLTLQKDSAVVLVYDVTSARWRVVGGGGVADHGALTGLGDDDHLQYATNTEFDDHNARHETGGADAIKLDDLSAPDDNTDLNASTTKHGLLKKLPNDATKYLDGTGAFTDPALAAGGFQMLRPVQRNEVFSTATTCVVTMAAPTVGNTLVMFVGSKGRGADSITQTNVVWTNVKTANGNSQWSEIWLGVVSASPGTTATVNFTGSNSQQCHVLEVTQTWTTVGTTVTTTGTTALWQLTSDAFATGDTVLIIVSSNSPSSATFALNHPWYSQLPYGGFTKNYVVYNTLGTIVLIGTNSSAVAFHILMVKIS